MYRIFLRLRIHEAIEENLVWFEGIDRFWCRVRLEQEEHVYLWLLSLQSLVKNCHLNQQKHVIAPPPSDRTNKKNSKPGRGNLLIDFFSLTLCLDVLNKALANMKLFSNQNPKVHKIFVYTLKHVRHFVQVIWQISLSIEHLVNCNLVWLNQIMYRRLITHL